MSSTVPQGLLRFVYEQAADEYLRSLPPEHFMEPTVQATQRAITLASLALVAVFRPEVQVFNELLVQYPRKGRRRPGQVVPDNMAVVWDKPIKADTSYDLPLQPVGPFWVMEYVSKRSKRKDYETSFGKYERQLKVPYYLLFYPDNQELTLYHLTGKKYVSVKPNADERYAIPELELELALLDGWVRFWFRGELLPLPGELQQKLMVANRRADAETRRADEATRRAEDEARRADEEHKARLAAEQEAARLRAELEQLHKPQKKGRRNGTNP
ncbi:MAG TPA: Uma2 family endonuclease [Gemmataceae bacterium]|nr:Uma2 family endonuclease [Gemmataceae bacterium]